MKNSLINCIILAAGKGTRMKSDKAKVLHEVAGQPMLHHVLNAVAGLEVERTVVIVGHQKDAVIDTIAHYRTVTVVQEEQLGTGHAVACAAEALAGSELPVLILCGDTPLIQKDTLKDMITDHYSKEATITLMTTDLPNPAGYGRIICQGDRILKIVEEKDATPEERRINEVNAGIYCVEPTFLFKALREVRPDNSQAEIYLTDIIEIANRQGIAVNRFSGAAAEEVLGVNSKEELMYANEIMATRPPV